MDIIETCEEHSRQLLQRVEGAVDEITAQLTSATRTLRTRSRDHSESAEKNSVEEENAAGEVTPCGQCELSKSMMQSKVESNTYCKAEDDVSPGHAVPVSEDVFRQRLVGFDARSSTPTPKQRSEPRKSLPKREDYRCESVSQKSKDSDGVWSLDSKPTAIASSREESTTVDFHTVEAVLPRRSAPKQILKDQAGTDEDDDLSDGSHSHTVYTIARLVSNLNAEKKKNEKLTGRIRSLEIELEAEKAKSELDEAKKKESDASHAAKLVEEIYAAQKERESAVFDRLKLAIKERDDALLRAKAMSKDARRDSLDKNNNTPKDTNLRQLLEAVCEAETGRATEKYGRDIASRIALLRNERNRITSEEMKAVICERDKALHSCRVLRRELRAQQQQRSSPEQQSLHKFESQEAKNKLRAAEEERDRALAKVTALEDEMETLKVYYSLHKKLSDSGKIDMTSSQSDDAERLAQALRVAHEHSHVQETNARRQEADCKRLREKNERLERLVGVLRKKLAILAEKSAQSVAEASMASRDQSA